MFFVVCQLLPTSSYCCSSPCTHARLPSGILAVRTHLWGTCRASTEVHMGAVCLSGAVSLPRNGFLETSWLAPVRNCGYILQRFQKSSVLVDFCFPFISRHFLPISLRTTPLFDTQRQLSFAKIYDSTIKVVSSYSRSINLLHLLLLMGQMSSEPKKLGRFGIVQHHPWWSIHFWREIE